MVKIKRTYKFLYSHTYVYQSKQYYYYYLLLKKKLNEYYIIIKND